MAVSNEHFGANPVPSDVDGSQGATTTLCPVPKVLPEMRNGSLLNRMVERDTKYELERVNCWHCPGVSADRINQSEPQERDHLFDPGEASSKFLLANSFVHKGLISEFPWVY